MSGSNRRGLYPALVAITALFAIVFIALLSQSSNDQIADPYPNPPQVENGDRQSVSKPVYLGLFTADDSFAQWIVALFTVAATAVSVKAVFLLRDTLKANSSAVEQAKDANKIARAAIGFDSRAWLKLTAQHVRVTPIEDNRLLIVWGAHVENIGKSPATDIRFYTRVVALSSGDARPMETTQSPRYNNGRVALLYPQERIRNRSCTSDCDPPSARFIIQIIGAVEYRISTDGPDDATHVTEIPFEVSFGECRNVFGPDLIDQQGGAQGTLEQSSDGDVRTT